MSSDHNQAKKKQHQLEKTRRCGAKQKAKEEIEKIPRTSSLFYRKNENLIDFALTLFVASRLKVGYIDTFFFASQFGQLANENRLRVRVQTLDR